MKILIEKAPLEDIGEAAYRLALSYKGFSISKEAYMEKFSELLHAALREALAEQVGQEPICCTYPKCNCINPTLCRAQNITAEQAEQEPVGRWNWNEAKFEWLTKFDYHKHHMTPLYAAPVRTKDLTDDEIESFVSEHRMADYIYRSQAIAMCRAVIAKDREKNK